MELNGRSGWKVSSVTESEVFSSDFKNSAMMKMEITVVCNVDQ